MDFDSRLTDWDLYWFARIYEQEVGEKLTLPQAREMATDLGNLYLILAGFPFEEPTPGEEPPYGSVDFGDLGDISGASGAAAPGKSKRF